MSAHEDLAYRITRHCSAETAARMVADHRAEVLAEGLTEDERQFLTFALELAADQMACRSDEFDNEDEAALKSLRSMATEPAPAADPADTLAAVRTAAQGGDLSQVQRILADHYADERGAS